MKTPDWDVLRSQMVEDQLRARNIRDPRVLDTMRQVPRHLFVPETDRERSYEDRALSTGFEQTISQPFMVGFMLQALGLTGHEKVLEIGTGTGYQAALLSHLAKELHTMEIIPEVAAQARANFAALGLSNIHLHVIDGSKGLPTEAPFDAIVVAAGAPEVPSVLLDQLAPEGRLVIPIGQRKRQELVLIQKRDSRWMRQPLTPCSFVPLRGAYGWPEA